jgi:hypothetical protein
MKAFCAQLTDRVQNSTPLSLNLAKKYCSPSPGISNLVPGLTFRADSLLSEAQTLKADFADTSKLAFSNLSEIANLLQSQHAPKDKI